MIYHYCTVAAFKSIIANKQVWLTDITKLNDRTEYKSGFDLIAEILVEKGLADKPIYREIHTDKLNNDFQILAGCFSYEGDVGSQWSEYADKSKGISIGFDEDEIEQFNLFNRFTENRFQPILSRVALRPVFYDRSKFIEKVINIIDVLEHNNAILKYKLMGVALRRLATIYKEPYFKDEREIRAIVELESGSDDKYVLDERTTTFNELATYHKLQISYQNFCAIKEIIIGPNCPLTQQDVECFLLEHNLKGLAVRYSSGRGMYRIAQ